MDLSTNALCAKAKAMYGKRLKEEQYSELIRKDSIGEVVTYLKGHVGYQDALKDINVRNIHRQQVEDLLKREYFERCNKMLKYIPRKNQEFYLKVLMKIEIEIILDKIQRVLFGSQEALTYDLPTYLEAKTSFAFHELVQAKNIQEIKECLMHSKYAKIMNKFDVVSFEDMSILEKELLDFYYQSYVLSIEKHFRGKTKQQLLDVLYTLVELKNMEKIYRLKTYFHFTPEQIKKTVSLQYGRLNSNTLDQLVESKDGKEFLKKLSLSRYQAYYDDQEYAYIEYYIDTIKYNVAKRYLRFSSNAPVVYLTYSILESIEIDNLKHIIEGIRYQKDPSTIEEMLICM
ncbi:V0D/AC39 family V-type ATPase subunit [Tannockella kyphosi]|uniref:V0D/AC39 family V-type ATPase subunit n=1 Tax=Tannockella kyphosi TaxID=2899121 RepID=UPI002010EDA1|nr:V-type ATPase subunit [Tannockella kyphosi]